MELQNEATFFSEDKTKKLEYIKIGSNYHIKIYNLIQDGKKRRYEVVSDSTISMTKKQLKNYIYSELYE